MLKKIIVAVLAMILILGITACQKPEDTDFYLTFRDIDGKEVGKIEISGEKITIPEAPAVEGYQFRGWYFDEKGIGILLTEDYFVNKPAKGNMQVYACYEEIQPIYTLTFNDAYGKEVTKLEISNKEIDLPEAPVNNELQFIGWFIDSKEKSVQLTPDYFVKNPATEDLSAYPCYAEDSAFTVLPSSISGCAITGIKGSMTDVVIPEKMTIVVSGEAKEYVVEEILASSFATNSEIETVFIPNTVKRIGMNAFMDCTNLRSITVPTTVTADNVGTGIFKGADALSEITAPTWVVAHANNKNLVNVTFNAGDCIFAEMFKDADKLESVVLPSGLTAIEKAAFSGAAALKSIDIPASVTRIEQDAFTYCKALETITVAPANSIYTSNNSNCIVEVEFDSENGNIETLIAGCSSTVIYEGIERIGKYAFIGCVNLKTLEIPSTVTSISEGAFYDCISLEEIKVSSANAKYTSVGNCLLIPHEMRLVQGCKNSIIDENINIAGVNKKLLTISPHAFASCVDLEEIYIPSSVVSLDADTFKNCTSLSKVVIENKDLKLNGDVFSGCSNFKDIKLPMPLLGYFVEKSRNVLENITLTSGDSIADNFFIGCDSLVSVNLPDTLEKIGVAAFQNCKKLISVNVTENSAISVIERNAFEGCSAFTKIEVSTNARTATAFVVPATVEVIGNYAFKGCAMTAVEFAENGKLRSIEYKVFADCKSLDSITIPSYIETVDFDAFHGCENIKNASMPSDFIRVLSNARKANGQPSVTTLEIVRDKLVYCYYIREMKNLTTLKIGADIEYIDNRSFEGCSSLQNIEVAAGNTKYFSEEGCLVEKATNTLILGTVNSIIPDSVTTISSYAFALSSIPKIVIPDNVTLVEEFAFSSCRSLADVEIESAATVIEERAFDGSDAIVKAKIPACDIRYISKAALAEVEIIGGDIPAYAFKDCVTLKTVVVSTEVTSVGDSAFIGCDQIVDITAPASILKGFSQLKLEKLGINKFDEIITKEFIDNFKDVKYLYMVASDTDYIDKINDDAFSSCKSIEEADVPAWIIFKIPTESIKKLVVNSGDTLSGNFTFPMLSEVVFGKSITDINAKVFRKSNLLATITVDENNTKYTVANGCVLDGTNVVLASLDFTLPETVTAIGAYALAGRSSIESVTLHEGIVSIGDNAFEGCSALKIASFPVSLKAIGIYAFCNCGAITEINLPGIETIGVAAFDNCAGAAKIILPAAMLGGEGVIGANAFNGCNSVTYAAVPVFAIGSMPKYLDTLEVTAGTALDAAAIVNFTNLKTLTIGETVTSISPLVFVSAGNEATYASTVTTITVADGNAVYYSMDNCVITKSGNKLILGANVGETAVPSGVTEIVENAFLGCTDITSLTLPASLTELSPLSFLGCTSIATVNVAEGNTTYYSEGNCVIKKEGDVVNLIMGCKTSVIPENVSVICDYAFYGVSTLTEINIPNSVVTVGSYAFAKTGVTEIRIPTSVTGIGNNAFDGCPVLNKVIVLENSALATIASNAFSNCVSLKLIVIPGTISTVAGNALNKNVQIYWYGTETEFKNSTAYASLSGATVYYYSASNNPGCWYYKDNGTNVAIW